MKRQRGVALIIALLALVLAVLLAVALIDSGEATAARWRAGWRAEQSWQLQRGLEAWAAQGLLADQRASGKIDSLDEAWAREMPPVEIPGARIRGRLRDLGGCFNINALLFQGQIDEPALRRLQRLLTGLQLPPELAAQAADLLDADSEPRPGGAEDAAYAALPPSARSANGPLADASELLRLPAMTPESWTVLQPLLCALPADHKINLNTAPAAIWMTLDDAITPTLAERLVRSQARAFVDHGAVVAALERVGVIGVGIPEAYALGSDYFVAEAAIDADGIEFAYTSLLQRLPGEVRVLARARGGRAPEDDVIDNSKAQADR